MKIFKPLCGVPGLGPIVKIANAYAYQGDYQADQKFAPFRLWLKAFGPELLISLALTCVTMLAHLHASWVAKSLVTCGDEFYCKPGALAVAIIPSILGFGIGVYALIFTLSAAFVKNVHDKISDQRANGERGAGSELMLNADLALPLLSLVVALIVGIIQQALPAHIGWVVVTWVALWFSVLSLLGLISVIFGLAEHSLLDKTK